MVIIGVRFRSQGPALVVDEAVMQGEGDEAPTKMERKMAEKFKEIAMDAFRVQLEKEASSDPDAAEMHFAKIDSDADINIQEHFDSQSFFHGISGMMKTFFAKLPEGLPKVVKVEG